MQATQILMEEHRVIEQVLSALQMQAQRLESGGNVRVGFFLEAVDFARNFADGCHHRKEEGVLFPAMTAAGMPRESGPIAVMLSEHEQGRAFVRAMEAAAKRLEAGETNARNLVAINARSYVALLLQHIAKEDTVLFPLADRVIPEAAKAGVAEEFDRIEREETGAGVHEKFHALAEALAKETAG
jgi:hemerythrin-like domain-containing protein